MLKQDQISALTNQIRNAQIIMAALILGVLGFAGVMIAIVPFQDLNQKISILVLVGLFVAVPAIGMSIVLPRVTGQGAAKTTADRLKHKNKTVDDPATILECANQFQIVTIMRGALLEGVCFLNVIVFFVDHSLVSLSVVGALVLLMAVSFPTTSRAIEWIENQLERVRDHSRSGS